MPVVFCRIMIWIRIIVMFFDANPYSFDVNAKLSHLHSQNVSLMIALGRCSGLLRNNT